MAITNFMVDASRSSINPYMVFRITPIVAFVWYASRSGRTVWRCGHDFSASPRGGRYKYEGGVVGPDGSIYFAVPQILLKVIPPPPDSTVKPRCVLIGESLAGEKMTSDKYQNGKLGLTDVSMVFP